jgi:hypothetical protein
MKRLKCAAIGLPVNEKLLLGSLLELVALTDGHVFALTDDESEADIMFLDPASLAGRAYMAKPNPGLVSQIHYCPADLSLPNSATWVLQSPLRFGGLRVLLIDVVEKRRAVMQALSRTQAAELQIKNAAVPEHQTAIAAHRKFEHIIGLMQRLSFNPQPQLLHGPQGVQIVLNPANRSVSISGREAAHWQRQIKLCGQSITMVIFQMPQATPETIILSQEQFHWELAKHVGSLVLLPGIAGFETFSLSRWPDLGALGAGQFDLRICALLSNREFSISNIMRAVPIAHSSLIGFLNGCALLGCMRSSPTDLLHGAERPRIRPQPLPPTLAQPFVSTPAVTAQRQGFLGLLGKLRSALSFNPKADA